MSEKFSIQDIFHRVFHFILCGLVILGVYFVGMFSIYTFAAGLLMPDGEGNSLFSFMGTYGWFIVYSLAYGFPLYFIYFRKDAGFKVFLLRITEKEFSWKTVFREFTVQFGKYDLIVYAAFAALLLLPFKDWMDNPAVWVSIPQVLFYLLPVPRLVSYLLAVIWFVMQYYACLWFAARYWDKHRLRPKS